MTKDATCQADIETVFQDLSDNENRLLITAVNNHIKSLEKQLDKKQVNIKTLLKNLQNFFYNNIFALATINLIKFFVKISALLREKKKRLARLTNQFRYMTTTATILVLRIKKQLENQKKINPKLLITLLMISKVKK